MHKPRYLSHRCDHGSNAHGLFDDEEAPTLRPVRDDVTVDSLCLLRKVLNVGRSLEGERNGHNLTSRYVRVEREEKRERERREREERERGEREKGRMRSKPICDFASGFPEWFSLFERHQTCQVLLVLHHQIVPPPKDRRPLLR